MRTYLQGNLERGKDIHRGVGLNVTCDVPSYSLVTLLPISRTSSLPNSDSIRPIPLRFKRQISQQKKNP